MNRYNSLKLSLPRPGPAALRKTIPWLVVALLMAAFAIRVYQLGASDLTFDEAASAFIADKPYGEMLTYLRGATREHPPVYYGLLRAWTLAAGRSEYALRFFSVLFATLGIALAYRLGRRILGRSLGLLAVALLVVQPFHVHYSQDARSYALMTVQALLLFELFHNVRCGKRLGGLPQWVAWLILGMAAVASVLTHYYMIFILVALNLYALTTLKDRHARPFALVWFGTQLLAGIALFAYILLSHAAVHVLAQFHGYSLKNLVVGRAGQMLWMVDDLLWGVQAHPWPSWSYAVFALVIAGVLLALLWLPRQKSKSGQPPLSKWLLPIYALVPLMLAWLMPERLNARYSAAILPAYCLIVGLAILWLSRRHWLLGLIAFGLLAAANTNMLTINQRLITSDYGDVVSYLNTHLQPGDAIILNGPWQWVQQLYYPVDPQTPTFWLPRQVGDDPAVTHLALQDIARQFGRVWVLPAALKNTDPEQVVLGWLRQNAYYASHYKELELYSLNSDSAALAGVVNAQVETDFGGTFRLQQATLWRTQARPGEVVLADLSIQAKNPPGSDMVITLQLVDQDGNAWNTLAFRPGDNFSPPQQWTPGQKIEARRGIVVPPGAPPGDYAVRVGALLYPSEVSLEPSRDGQPLPNAYVEVGGIHVSSCSNCLSPLNNTQALQAHFGDLTLIGARLAGQDFWQGHYLAFELAWQAERPLSQDYRLRIALIDRNGQQVASAEARPVANWYPTSQWIAQQPLWDRQALLIPPRQQPGVYTLRISVLDAEGKLVQMNGVQTEQVLGLFSRTVTFSGTTFDVSQVNVRPRERTYQVGKISHPLSVTLGDSVRLLGYDWDGPPTPGQDLRLVLYWQSLRELDTPYTIFTHIMGANDTLAGQKDSWPRNGEYPTNFWIKGEIISDVYLIPFSPQAAPGDYHLEVGLYDTETGDRLRAVQDGQPLLNDIIILEHFQVPADSK